MQRTLTRFARWPNFLLLPKPQSAFLQDARIFEALHYQAVCEAGNSGYFLRVAFQPEDFLPLSPYSEFLFLL